MLQLGRYTLMRRVGVGGMAEIWKAKVQGPAGFEKTVAIKKILPHLLQDSEFIEMFVEEAKLVARLVHPNIVQVFDFGMTQAEDVEGVGYFIAMEYVAGQNLATVLKKMRDTGGRVPFEIALYIGIETAKALAHAHAGHAVMDEQGRPQQIVHRDVSPHNVLVSYLGEVKVTDFGIAKVANALSRTSGGILKGKVAYMSPEQARLQNLDGRSDIFCLGIVLYHLVTGKPLFDGKRSEEIYQKITKFGGLKPDQLLGVPQPVADILEIALQADPDLRYQHATAMEVALSQVLGPTGVVEARRALGSLTQKLFSGEYQREKSGAVVPSGPIAEATVVNSSGSLSFQTSTSNRAPVPSNGGEEVKLEEDKTAISDSFSVRKRVRPADAPEELKAGAEPPRPRSRRWVSALVLGGLVIIAVAVAFPKIEESGVLSQLLNRGTPLPTSTAAPTATTLVANPTATRAVRPPTARPRTPTPAPSPRVVVYRGTGLLTVNAKPWVRVKIGSKTLVDETPLRRMRMKSGKYTLTFINPVERFSSKRTIEIRKDRETKIFVNVQAKKITVTER